MMKLTVTRTLYSYWDELRAGRSAPERSDLDPSAIRALLGDVFLLELESGKSGNRQVVRLAGTRICALLGRELRGSDLADVFAIEDRRELGTLVEGVANTSIPVVAGIAGLTGDDRTLDLELQLLPLRHRGRTHTRLLGSIAPVELPYWAGSVPLALLRLLSVRHEHPHANADLGEAEYIGSPVRSGGGPLRVLPGGRA